jgi:hypothetical protein
LYYDLFPVELQPIKTPKSLNKLGDILNIFIFSLSIITWRELEEIVFLLAILQILNEMLLSLHILFKIVLFQQFLQVYNIKYMLHELRKKLAVIIVCLFALSFQAPHAFACSLWAATGGRLIDGGTLVGMTWDVPQETKGELKLVIPKKGFRYLGLFPLEAKISAKIVAGVNEHGLVTVTATADTIVLKRKLAGRSDLVETILTSFSSVDAVFASKAHFARSSPLFLIVADQSKVALVQIGPNGHFAVETTSNGLFYQTNHYTNQNLLKENERYNENSLLRLNRLQYLLVNYHDRFSIDDFNALAGDKNNGPDNSIWRIGSSPKKERTLARWIVFLPKNSSPELYFKLANPDSNELNYDIKLDKPFWTEGTE